MSRSFDLARRLKAFRKLERAMDALSRLPFCLYFNQAMLANNSSNGFTEASGFATISTILLRAAG